MKKLNTTLKEIFKMLSSFESLKLKTDLVKINDSQIITPIGDVIPTLFKQKSKLKNELIDPGLLKNLLTVLNKNHSIVRLNHIGFGYQVASQQEERQRLIHLTRKTDLHLYEEKSSDIALWLFLGNTGEWEKPLVEFCPIEQDHPESDYFLPHIQIDIDTTLNADELESIVKQVFNGHLKSFRLAITNGVACIVRNRLGVIDGVNIFLDLATNARKVEAHRKSYLRRIS